MNDRDHRTVYVIRHGATAWNEQGRIVGHQDLDLSSHGQTQAAGAGNLLSRCRLDQALTSPLLRTRRTATIVLGDREVPIETDKRLIELALKGWEGRSRRDLQDDPRWQSWITAPQTITTPEGEALDDVRERAVPALEQRLRRLPEGGGLALFTHGGVARVLILHLMGMPLSAYQKLRCDCASVNAFEVTAEGELIRVLGLNLTQPLIALSGHPVG